MKNNPFIFESILLRAYKSCKKISWKKSLALLLPLIFTVSCKKITEQTGLTGVCPLVISTIPQDKAVLVSLNTMIDARFNEAMDSSTLNALTFTLRQGTVAIPGLVSYSDSMATFVPSGMLAPNTTYTATITTGVRDPANNAMVNDYVWTFTTGNGPDITLPIVVSTDPANDAVEVPFNKTISAVFSEPMKPSSIPASFTITNTTLGGAAVLGTVSYSGTTAVFAPAANLSPRTTYTGTITTGATDLAGNALAANYTWNFTTADDVPPLPLGTAAFFGAFGGSAGVTNQGLNSKVNNGRLGSTAASSLITGFHDGLTGDIYTETPLNVGDVTGGIFTAPPSPGTSSTFLEATMALFDANVAYNNISPASKPGGTDPGDGELGGLTLSPGIYLAQGGTFNITNLDLTLDAKGDPNAVWIFQMTAGLTVGTSGPTGARTVNLINGARAGNVFWYVGSAAVINGAGGGTMVGTIIASSGITFSTAGNVVQTVLNGRALSLNSSVTMVNTTINVP